MDISSITGTSYVPSPSDSVFRLTHSICLWIQNTWRSLPKGMKLLIDSLNKNKSALLYDPNINVWPSYAWQDECRGQGVINGIRIIYILHLEDAIGSINRIAAIVVMT
jgi:hypothetical protein